MSERKPIAYDFLVGMFYEISKGQKEIGFDYQKLQEFILEQKDVIKMVGGIVYDEDRRYAPMLASYFNGLCEAGFLTLIPDSKNQYSLDGKALECSFNRFVSPALVNLETGRLERLARDFEEFVAKN